MSTSVSDISTGSLPDEKFTGELVVDTTNKPDPFHGRERIATMLTRFIVHLFGCPVVQSAPKLSRLDHSIAYALHRTRLEDTVVFAGLLFLHRFKRLFPDSTGSSGHRLFIVAYMLASKIICDGTFSNQSWCTVAQNAFSLRDLNTMERDMCFLLDWDLSIYEPMLAAFISYVNDNYSASGPLGAMAPFHYRVHSCVDAQLGSFSFSAVCPDDIGGRIGEYPLNWATGAIGVEHGLAGSSHGTMQGHTGAVHVEWNPDTWTNTGHLHPSQLAASSWQPFTLYCNSGCSIAAPVVTEWYPIAFYYNPIPGYWYPVAIYATASRFGSSPYH